jgi:NADP-dependent 3-hydroxy acid dehydrogenase YdfG
MTSMEAETDLMHPIRRKLRSRNVRVTEITPMQVDESIVNCGQDGAEMKSPATCVKSSLRPPKVCLRR